ncbi:class I SAM-dependent methyltransferase [Candidatus Kapabacteria bacterium]|nr:class I SAM-dependent methyltransferase [Candidatus Kapabacteria bacterium]
MNCKICNSANTKSYTLGKTKLLECIECGVTSTLDVASEKDLKQHYENNYKIQDLKNNYSREKRRVFRFPEQIKLISDIIDLRSPPSKLLDIGSGDGFFLDEARRYGYECKGVELSEYSRDYCKKIGLHIESSIQNFNNKFDIITMWHVFEHIPNPNDFLKEVLGKLDSDGKLIIRVPAFDNLWKSIFKHRWIWFQPQNHYFHYTEKSLRTVFEKNGFNVLNIERRRPNNHFTKKMNRFAVRLFDKFLAQKPAFIDRIKRLYEDTTGIEYYLVAEKKDI